ncbi:orotidine-5'-phosphate decarboxylase [Alkalilimnicola ehrlichii]|uniref:Orotidine 5'-phosphate decarboxylase n=1 Tax=Alkalilimnicola ehrlichii TaxID=351052 RepID=A0A3E0WKW1_9GAMM|nr:orotidine-5'-phosphate decarboxylase [Alkalilimnicola ehrlichii]RFA33592.1 orotidine-5'-phosphate decarboxylase [Alkalilimnicola ehrlichii]
MSQPIAVDGPRILVALDFPDAQAALALVEQLDPARCRLKVGKELFVAAGPVFVRQLIDQGYDVFLDLKFHDIPNTVASACRAAAELGVWMVNVHALGGSKMMRAAREALAEFPNRPLLIAVTVLTSHDAESLAEIGLQEAPAAAVARLARLVDASGLDGVVCSAREAALLREQRGPDFKLVCPGIRPSGAVQDDQSRITTPADAIDLGVDYMVIGRPITRATDPLAALAKIEKEIGKRGKA